MSGTERARFLAELEATGNVAFACAAADVSRSVAFDERELFPSFEHAWRAAQERARRARVGTVTG